MNKPVAALLAAALCLGPQLALAGPTEDAKVLFNVGAQAYDKADFVAALQAFEAAYRLTPRPGVLFSIAQAHRKQFYTGGKQVEHLRAAIAAYREYLVKVEQGGRRSDAAEALADLEAVAARTDMGTVAPVAPVPQAQPATRVMINAQIPDALISLDGARPHESPLVAAVKPGPHTVRVTAAGYFDESREITATAGEVLPVDVPLREKPARLSVTARAGAQVSIDGRLAATTPLSQALDVPPGRHLIAVTHNGYRAFSQEIEVARDEARAIDVHLDATVQRSVSYTLVGVGAAGVVAGAALLGVSLYYQGQAQTFDDNRKAGQLSCTTTAACQALFSQYTSAQSSRDDFRLDGGIVLGAGALVGAVGLMLFAFDMPTLGGAAPRRDDVQKPATPTRERGLDVTASPILGPGLYGASFGGRF
jgi:hypothetical protein